MSRLLRGLGFAGQSIGEEGAMQRRSSIKFQAFPAVINWILGYACEDKTPQSLEERSVRAMSWAQPAEQHSTGSHGDSASEWPLRKRQPGKHTCGQVCRRKGRMRTKSFLENLKHLKRKFKFYHLFFSWILKASFIYPAVLENTGISYVSYSTISLWS